MSRSEYRESVVDPSVIRSAAVPNAIWILSLIKDSFASAIPQFGGFDVEYGRKLWFRHPV